MKTEHKKEIRDTTGNILRPGMYGYEERLAASVENHPQTATPRRFCKVTKRDIGRNVLFLAYDGRNYRAELKDLKRGIASLVYRPFNSSGIPCDFLCTAYVSDLTRVIPTF